MASRSANTYTAYVNPRYTKNERNQIGLAIINYIVERTKKGKGIGNVSFKNSKGQSRYSKNYQDTVDFKISGKSPSKINLSLTGDMLDSITILDTELIGRIVIGFSDPDQNDKSVYMREKGYNFLGLTKQELDSILLDYGQPSQGPSPANISGTFVESFVRGLFRG